MVTAESKVRIGIDVGGTFTHAVALDAQTFEIIGKSRVPTTHRAAEGVALGIIQSLLELLEKNQIAAKQVVFIAHSTTQATNALLEGDVPPVGILAMAASPHVWISKLATNLGKIKLAPNKFLHTHHRFIDITKSPSNETICEALQDLVQKGSEAIAISQAFSVDKPDEEQRALGLARNMGLLATSGVEVSQLYGLKVRTRTAAINAAMLSKMIESANMTEKSVRQAGIQAPIMIMRSDGGVMDIDAMRRKPILTALSGPAAGVAAAMMFLNISDGIFLEVGGTSTDISAISNGRAQVRSGEIGGHRIYMRTLDVRTVGVAGGSMPRLAHRKLIEVGPRSAHIAGLKYSCFDKISNPKQIKFIQPLPKDPADYVALAGETNEAIVTVTPTCAANFLGYIFPTDYAAGNIELVEKAIKPIAQLLHKSCKEVAEQLMELSVDKIIPIVKSLISDYKLDIDLVQLIGGGGGAAAILPYLSKKMNMTYRLAKHADVVSAIGVALALIRETVERQFVNPTNDDILRVREQAFETVQNMGADPASIEVHMEVDTKTNTVRATASGATSLIADKKKEAVLSENERLKIVAQSMHVPEQDVKVVAQTQYFRVYAATWLETGFWRLLKNRLQSLRVVDNQGCIRLQIKNGIAELCTVGSADQDIMRLVDEHAKWGDAGKVIPDMMLLIGPKISDLSGLLDINQIIVLAKAELEIMPKDAKVILISKLN